jgi:hypothetical protein
MSKILTILPIRYKFIPKNLYKFVFRWFISTFAISLEPSYVVFLKPYFNINSLIFIKSFLKRNDVPAFGGAFCLVCLVLRKVDYKAIKNGTGKDLLKKGAPATEV